MGSKDWPDWWLRACGLRGNQFESALPAVLPQAVDELKIHGTSAWLQGQQRKPIALQLAATPSRSGGARCPRVFRIRRSSSVNTLKRTRRRLPHPLGCSTPAGWHRGFVGTPDRAVQLPARGHPRLLAPPWVRSLAPWPSGLRPPSPSHQLPWYPTLKRRSPFGKEAFRLACQ